MMAMPLEELTLCGALKPAPCLAQGKLSATATSLVVG
jgi:hypothetical protein